MSALFNIDFNIIKEKIFVKRPLYCANCSREVSGGKTIFAKMPAPKNIVMVEIKAYLKKNSTIFCESCFKNESAKP